MHDDDGEPPTTRAGAALVDDVAVPIAVVKSVLKGIIRGLTHWVNPMS